MGFDPRQPVKPQAPVSATPRLPRLRAADQLADEGDFDIDLEKELMGEFGSGAEDGAAVAEVREPAFETAARQDGRRFCHFARHDFRSMTATKPSIT